MGRDRHDRHDPSHVDGLGLLAAQSSAARSAIFPSKLRPAAHPAHLILRPRLHQLLAPETLAAVTLVVAPAGSGKTSLLATWVAGLDLPHAWLSLDETDRDPVQLWRGILAALEGIAPGCAVSVADRFRRGGQLTAAVGALLDELEERDLGPRVLVIDDLQLVDDDEVVVSSLALFVQHLPTWLRVVIASRHEPRLPVHRLRARGQLGEVHFAELRFTPDEALAVLGRLVPELGQDQARDAAAHAGGWAASIQLAALTARSARARGVRYLPQTGDGGRRLADYVWHEVLAAESEELVDVLLATSVVERIDPGLAQVLAERPDASELLATAESRGLFVTWTEPTGCYEIHRLVREALLAVLSERSPDRLRRLEGWAAGWYEAHGQAIPALDHWLRADEPGEALRLLAAQVPALYDGGHESTIQRVIAAIPAAVAAEDVQAMIRYAWCHLLLDRHRFTSLVDATSRSVRDELDLAPALLARLEVLQSIAATLRGHWADGASLARSAVQLLGETWWLDPLGPFAWNMIARDAALSEQWDESGPEARTVLRALDLVPERRIAIQGTRALGEALAGRPIDALRVVAGARKAAEAANLSILRVEATTAEAIAHRELGNLTDALPLLLESSVDCLEATPHCVLIARLQLVGARVDEGDLESAGRIFGEAAELVDTELTGPGARSWLATVGVQLALATKDPERARDWASQVSDPFWSAVGSARILLATGERGPAYDALKSAEPRCLRHRVVHDLTLFRATEAPEDAERHLLEAVRVASGHGMVQTVASEGREVVEAVELLAWRAPVSWLDRLRRAAVSGGPAPLHPGRLPAEQLTERELEVLRMLPSRLTLREIADELYISINTLKFHLKVVYRKLDCASRAEASEVARSLTGLRSAAQPSSTLRR
ncbi:LuxR C-terminal-related transcriptional regulator [Nocardioides sp. URHA0020]|uniref:LuxR C-terminal-related transcriptional regulator n=1 Tax=Nocardioides sp. URHA0020 TaxID=1380392 RepID=UPI000490BD3D|nr:LuxR family transcriptional regulator [Nocardioides sp. URHA0020]